MSAHSRAGPPRRIVVMGVSGSGKTTVGSRVAERLGADFVDADSLHPPENIAKMAAGVPLTDEDRRPWLRRTADVLADAEGTIVVTCSALKRAYRDVLRAGADTTMAMLTIDPATARERVAGRRDHFMGVEMVTSQFAALEPPGPDERDVVCVSAAAPVDRVVDDVLAAIGADVSARPPEA